MKTNLWLLLIVSASIFTSSGQNLIRNPGFEEGITPWPWERYSGYANLTTTTNFPHSGLRAALVYGRRNTYAGPSQSLLGILQPGQTYICSGWTRVERNDNEPTKLSMRQIDGAGTQWHGLANGVAYSNRWTFISGTFTLNITGTLTDLTLYFEGPSTNADYLVDDASVTLPWPPPPAPTDVVTRTGDRTVVLHWNRSSGERPVAGYHVSRAVTPDGLFLRLTTSPVPLQSCADLLVTNGVTYFYCVSAVDEMGQESTNSVSVSATPRAFADNAEFLDYVQHTAVDYFWYEANPLNGLVRERSRSNAVASIAATGFGLTALGIGIDHGWLTSERGRERALATLQTLWSQPQGAAATGTMGYNGWFYQSLNVETGRRAGTAELATLDNALLLAGVLHARQYFGGNNAVEAEIRALAEQIFNRVDWGWMTFGSHTLAKGWRPESGFNLPGWTGYNEALLLYLLGLSATNGLAPNSWHAWTNGYQWQTNYGYRYLACPPLAGHLWPQCWIDFRHIADACMNEQGLTYFENSRRAVLAQRAYAIDNPGGWGGYGPWVWGFSSCDGPGTNGWTLHGAPPAQNDDGTIAPNAVGGALPFAPECALPALRRFYEKFRTSLWTGYGFADAFNPQSNWWDREVVGVDQGALLVSIENYRTERVWQRCRAIPELQRGLQAAGFRPLVFVRSPLALARHLEGFVLEWEAVPGRNYQVEYSSDLDTWLPSPTGFLTATSPSLNWADAGPPATPEVPGAIPYRFYRVLRLGPP